MFFGRNKKRKQAVAEDQRMKEAIQRELGGYLKNEDVKEYLAKIKKEESRVRLWESLSARKKIKILKYVLAKRRDKDDKK